MDTDQSKTPEILEPKTEKKPKRHWIKVGVELEGGWDEQVEKVATRTWGADGPSNGVRHDGSVGGTPAMFHGEVITRPHANLNHLLEDIKKMYPAYINDSMGFHIHVSLSPMDVTCLADPAFWSYFRHRWEVWATKNNAGPEFWRRWEGKPTGPRRQVFCAPKFDPVAQLNYPRASIASLKKLRYTALNFVSFHEYGTIECRHLPMFTSKELTESSVRELLDIYDTYLTNVGFNKIRLDWTVEFDEVRGMVEKNESFYPTREPLHYSEDSEYDQVPEGDTYAFEGQPEVMSLMTPFTMNVGRAL